MAHMDPGVRIRSKKSDLSVFVVTNKSYLCPPGLKHDQTPLLEALTVFSSAKLSKVLPSSWKVLCSAMSIIIMQTVFMGGK